MDDLISRQAAINSPVKMVAQGLDWVPVYHLEQLPSAEREWRNNMTVHDLLEWGEYVLRNDREYQEEIERIKGEIDKLVYRQRAIMAAAIVRLAVAMVTEQSASKCADCTGGYCEEECMEAEENGNKE